MKPRSTLIVLSTNPVSCSELRSQSSWPSFERFQGGGDACSFLLAHILSLRPSQPHAHAPLALCSSSTMRVINSRASLLSDYEVLSLLRDIEAQQRDLATQPAPAVYGTPASSLLPNGLLNPLISRSTLSTSAGPTPAQAIAEAEDPDAHLALIPANLRTIQYEALAYLSNTTRACAHMHEHHIPEFLAALKEWEKEEGLAEVRLTKGERLMCVNHVPQTLVELSAVSRQTRAALRWDTLEQAL